MKCNAMQCNARVTLKAWQPPFVYLIKYPSNLPDNNLYPPSLRRVDLITTIHPRSTYSTLLTVPCCLCCSCRSLDLVHQSSYKIALVFAALLLQSFGGLARDVIVLWGRTQRGPAAASPPHTESLLLLLG